MPNQPSSTQQSRYFPTRDRLKNPEDVEREMRQVLTQHYTLVDQYTALKTNFEALSKSHAELTAKFTGPNAPPGSGPIDSRLLGLWVLPIDANTLADGAKLTFVKKSGNLQFK